MTGTFPDDAARHADEEAVEWVILLREEADEPETRARFEDWLAASPLHAEAWAAAAYAYDRAGDARPAYAPPVRAAEPRPVLPAGPSPYRRRGGTRRSPGWRRLRVRHLVVAAVAACLMLAVAPSVMLRAQADYRTGTAELQQAQLADGSVAHLAPGSAIAVSYGANRREIRLLKGEAWFDVRHDPARPFYVDANGVTTTDIGTAFDVRLDAGGVTTQVTSGRVRVAYAARPPVSEHLAGGDAVRVGFDGAVERSTMPPAQMAAWRNRQIIVHDRPATDVIDALRPWFAGVIVVGGDGFAHQRITGVYNAGDPAEALRGLTQAYGGSVQTITPWMIVISSS
ncbi:FecR family protein [Novosphingobium sp. PhB165]|uniref:FecR family protein n=1 Tax=Novosphingobium sp. PhB165 TaxID=2485105 RepID=UPI001051C6C1|nr:FecR domain-containing protein [Novosphingobium sp. PhB165]TCM20399.1 FecR family protein [Novosphingobium sp. PhB165]